MGLWDKLTNELVDIIQWTDDSPAMMVWRFPRYESEIKYGAQLTVREGQVAAFINEGKLADVYQPGMYTLTTQNMPILSTLRGWKYGFQSPFKADVYFVSTKTFTDRKWGTKNPIMLRDSEFGVVRIRAFGTYAIKVSDAAALLRQVVGAEAVFTVDQIEDQLRDLVVTRFADVVGSSKIPVLDLAGNYEQMGKFVAQKIQPDFTNFGLQIVNLLVENISLPPEVEQAMDKRTSMGVVGNLQQYTQFQVANSVPDAAKNPGGLASMGAGLGFGVGIASQMAGAMNAGAVPSAPPPLPGTASYFIALDGHQAGPFDMAALTEQITAGKLTRETLAWKAGMAQWTPAGLMADLAGLFANVPPAMPK